MKKLIILFIFCIASNAYGAENKNYYNTTKNSFKPIPSTVSNPISSKKKFQNNVSDCIGVGAGINVFLHCQRKSNYHWGKCALVASLAGLTTSLIVKEGIFYYETNINTEDN